MGRLALGTALVFTVLSFLPSASAAPSYMGWQAPATVDSGTSSVEEVELAVLPTGETMAAWRTPSGGDYGNLYSDLRLASNVWWNAPNAVNPAAHGVRFFAIDLSPSCTLEQTIAYLGVVDGNTSDVRVFVAQRLYGGAVMWNVTQVGVADYYEQPPFVVCRNNDITVVWSANDGARVNLWVNQSIGGVWQGATLLDNLDDTVAGFQASTDADGDVVVAWVTEVSSLYNTYWSIYVPGDGWTTPTNLSQTASMFQFYPPSVLVQPGGQALAVWFHPNVSYGSDLLFVDYTPGVGSSAPRVAYTVIGYGSLPLVRLSVDGLGREWAVWMGPNQAGGLALEALRRVNGTWGYPDFVGGQPSSAPYGFAFAVDRLGNAFVVWERVAAGVRTAHLARYVEGSGWRDAEAVPPEMSASPIFDVKVAADSSGSAVFAWILRGAGFDRVYVREYWPYNNPPTVRFYTVWDGMVVTVPVVQIDGYTDADAQFIIGFGRPVVDTDGSFGLAYGLSPGDNSLEVYGEDRFGNVYRAYYRITFNDPMPGLLAALASAEANVTAVQESLNASSAALTEAQANLSAAQEAVDALEATGTATQAELSAATARVAAAEANVSALTTSNAALAAELVVQTTAAANMRLRLDALETALAAAQAQLAAQNASTASARQDATDARAAATTAEASVGSASMMALIGVITGIAGTVVGVLSMMRGGGGGGGTGAREKASRTKMADGDPGYVVETDELKVKEKANR